MALVAAIFADQTNFNITGYSVKEDATPVDPSDTTGGVGTIDFSVREVAGHEGSVQLQGIDIELRDDYRGSTVGTVAEVTGQDGLVTLSSDARLGSLVGTVSAKPMVDTLQNVVLYYLQLGGITAGIYIDPTVAFTPVAVPGFHDDVWLRLKQLASVHGCEVSLVSNKVVIRPMRSFAANTKAQSELTWAYKKGDAAQNIEVTYYGNEWQSHTVLYPFTADEIANHQTWEVADGATLEDDLEMSISIADIMQPVAVDSVPQNYGSSEDDGTLRSVYSVLDSNNKPVTAQTWTKGGGSITVVINEDTTSVHLKIVAPKYNTGLTYRIVGRSAPTATDTEGVDYGTLNLVGSGVYINAKKITVPTGVTPDISVEEIGTTIQVSAVATLDDAYRVANAAAGVWSGGRPSLSGTLSYINRIGGTGSVLYRTFGDFDADNTSSTFGAFSTVWAGKTFKQFDAYELSQVEDDFTNQTFGNAAGARLRRGDIMYRITSATITDENISFDAVGDTTIGDFDKEFIGTKFGDFDNRFRGKSFRQFDRAPLNAKLSTGQLYVPTSQTVFPVPTRGK